MNYIGNGKHLALGMLLENSEKNYQRERRSIIFLSKYYFQVMDINDVIINQAVIWSMMFVCLCGVIILLHVGGD